MTRTDVASNKAFLLLIQASEHGISIFISFSILVAFAYPSGKILSLSMEDAVIPYNWKSPKGLVGFAELQLFNAVARSDEAAVRLWLSRGANIATSKFHHSVLWIAGQRNDTDIGRILSMRNPALVGRLLTEERCYDDPVFVQYFPLAPRAPVPFYSLASRNPGHGLYAVLLTSDPSAYRRTKLWEFPAFDRLQIAHKMACCWPARRLIWIAHLKNRNTEPRCALALLPKDILRIIDCKVVLSSLTLEEQGELFGYQYTIPLWLRIADAEALPMAISRSKHCINM